MTKQAKLPTPEQFDNFKRFVAFTNPDIDWDDAKFVSLMRAIDQCKPIPPEIDFGFPGATWAPGPTPGTHIWTSDEDGTEVQVTPQQDPDLHVFDVTKGEPGGPYSIEVMGWDPLEAFLAGGNRALDFSPEIQANKAENEETRAMRRVVDRPLGRVKEPGE